MSNPGAPEPKQQEPRQENPLVKLLLEMGPLLLFFLANSKPDLFRPLVSKLIGTDLSTVAQGNILVATAVFMVAMLVSLVLTKLLTGRLPIMPLVSGAVVLVFGGLTLFFQDDTFIKLKPTIVNCLFGTVLLGGLAFGRPLLPYALGTVFDLDAAGWWKLTFRWGLFFFVLAALNEAIWRTQTTDFWVAFKVWGVMPLTMLFAVAQTPLMMKHGLQKDGEA